MLEVILLLSMTFFHIWDDYGRQGILANMKQKSWWKKQEGYSDKYENDWLIALIEHAFSWTFMIYIPIAIYVYINQGVYSVAALIVLLATFFLNLIIHAKVDDLKCNKLKINLWQDQMIHIVQIVITFILVVVFRTIYI